MVFDEARVRGAAGSGEFRSRAGRLLDRARDEFGELAGLGEERLAADGEGDVDDAAGAARDRIGFAADPVLQALRRLLGVEADVEHRARLGRDDVGGRIADIDGGEGQGRRLEMRVAVVYYIRRKRLDQRR